MKSTASGHQAIAKLLDAATTTQLSGQISIANSDSSYQATVTGTGTVTATVIIQFSNDGIGWMDGATIALTGTTTASDGFAAAGKWVYARANLTAISGTNAAVTVTMAE